MHKGNPSSANQSLLARWRISMAEFLTIELHTANLFVDSALAPCSLENRARYVQNARQALDTVLQFALRGALNDTEVAQVTEELGSVRSRLERLGENDFGHASVLDSPPRELKHEASKLGSPTVKALGRKAQRFEMQCRQLRTDCREMLAQHRALMKRNPGLHPQ